MTVHQSAGNGARFLSAKWLTEKMRVSRRNVSIEEAALVCGSRLFHARAAATGNARSPRVDRRVDGTSNVGESTERRRRWATISDVSRRLSVRYAGAVPCTQWYARTHNWNWIRSGTHNQCSSRSSGVVCSDVRQIVTTVHIDLSSWCADSLMNAPLYGDTRHYQAV